MLDLARAMRVTENCIRATANLFPPRSAWRSIRHKAARGEDGEVLYPGLQTVRFHDLRHTAVATMAEAIARTNHHGPSRSCVATDA